MGDYCEGKGQEREKFAPRKETLRTRKSGWDEGRELLRQKKERRSRWKVLAGWGIEVNTRERTWRSCTLLAEQETD